MKQEAQKPRPVEAGREDRATEVPADMYRPQTQAAVRLPLVRGPGWGGPHRPVILPPHHMRDATFAALLNNTEPPVLPEKAPLFVTDAERGGLRLATKNCTIAERVQHWRERRADIGGTFKRVPPGCYACIVRLMVPNPCAFEVTFGPPGKCDLTMTTTSARSARAQAAAAAAAAAAATAKEIASFSAERWRRQAPVGQDPKGQDLEGQDPEGQDPGVRAKVYARNVAAEAAEDAFYSDRDAFYSDRTELDWLGTRPNGGKLARARARRNAGLEIAEDVARAALDAPSDPHVKSVMQTLAIRRACQWSQLLVGIIKVQAEADVEWQFGGNNDCLPVHSLWLDYAQLVPIGLCPEVQDVVWQEHECSDGSRLATLNDDCMRQVLSCVDLVDSRFAGGALIEVGQPDVAAGAADAVEAAAQ